MLDLITVAAFTLPKSHEKVNEDSLLLPVKKKKGFAFAIADGVGSYAGASNASQLVVEYFNKSDDYPFSDVETTLKTLNSKLGTLEELDQNFYKAATTLTLGYIDEKGLHIVHIGDSRLYLKKEQKLIQLTKDHTQHQKLLDAGLFTERQLKKMPGKNILMAALSSHINLEFQFSFIELSELIDENNEIVLNIMSDGAYEFWEKKPKFSINTMSSPTAFSTSLLKRIQKNGPTDDHSLISMKFRTNTIG